MQRRRLTPVARAAFAATAGLTFDPQATATVFISTYGQPVQSLKLLETLADEASVSPAAFSLSVHNAVAGLYSIVHGVTGPSLTLGAGAEGLAAAFSEAAGLLDEQSAAQVLIVGFEDALPEAQRPYETSPPGPIGAAFLVCRTGGLPVTLVRAAATGTALPFWEQLRELICWLEGDAPELALPNPGAVWTYQRTDDGRTT
jgi:hypothetical protein